MTTVRQPAVAGAFYPSDSHELLHMLNTYLEAPGQNDKVPRAIIAPHAGYVYSGPVAGTAYKRLLPARSVIKRVVLLGPSHRVPFQGIAASTATAFATPLGTVPLDIEAIARLVKETSVITYDDAHDGEHCLEVHLPFLQEVLDDFKLVPLVVGDTSPEEVASVIELLWDAEETLFVISSDLSHYHDYETAQQMDAQTSRAIEALSPESIRFEQACGRVPVNGLLLYARQHGLHAETVDLRNSGDTAGPRDKVVGYGAYVFT